ncbi:acyltransferase family protein [Chryseobacterium sp. 1B4]
MFFVKNYRQKNYDRQVIAVFLLILISLMFVPLFYHNGLMALLFVPAIILISANNGRVARLFSLKPLEYLGEISYGIYITHIPVLYLLRAFFKSQEYTFGIDTVFVIYIVVMLLSSAVFYQFIEKPMRNLLRKIHFAKH